MERFLGKSAIVTGGASGIGRAIVERFVDEGCRVLALDINDELMDSLKSDMNQIRADACLTMHCDVFSREQIAEAISYAWKELGTVDILVNLAGGSMNGPTHFMEVTEEHLNKLVAFNLNSTFNCSQEFMRHHLEAGTHGVITNVVSQAAVQPNEKMRPAYAAAKGAVVSLTKVMAKEFGAQGFRVNALAPGYCQSTERIRQIWELREKEGIKDAMLQNVPMRRVSEPGEQAAVVAFLSSDDASYMTGEILNVSGGGI